MFQSLAAAHAEEGDRVCDHRAAGIAQRAEAGAAVRTVQVVVVSDRSAFAASLQLLVRRSCGASASHIVLSLVHGRTHRVKSSRASTRVELMESRYLGVVTVFARGGNAFGPLQIF